MKSIIKCICFTCKVIFKNFSDACTLLCTDESHDFLADKSVLFSAVVLEFNHHDIDCQTSQNNSAHCSECHYNL